jgi:hypothetical protein
MISLLVFNIEGNEEERVKLQKSITALQRAIEQMEWTAVSERLPDFDTPVLAAFANGSVHAMARYYENEHDGWYWVMQNGWGSDLTDWENFEAEDEYSPIMWTTLPTPPRQEEDKAGFVFVDGPEMSPILTDGSKTADKDTEYTISGDWGPAYIVIHLPKNSGKHSLSQPWGGPPVEFDPKTVEFTGDAKNATAVLLGNTWRIEIKRYADTLDCKPLDEPTHPPQQEVEK